MVALSHIYVAPGYLLFLMLSKLAQWQKLWWHRGFRTFGIFDNIVLQFF